MSAKSYLKAAKKALEEENYEYCIQLAKDALEVDPKSYFAYLFIGKSSHLLRQFDQAVGAYKKAIEIDPKQFTAWKGWNLIACNSSDYKAYFEFAGDYAELLIELGEGIAGLMKEISLYLKKYPGEEVYEEYLRALMPENKLGAVTNGAIEPYEKVIKKYLNIILNRETGEVSKRLTRARMKTKASEELNLVSWEIYKDSQVPHLFEELINIINDTDERRSYEDQFLRYRVKVLQSAPASVKPEMFKSVKEMIDGMVVVKHNSITAWNLYFDWSDFKDLSAIDENVLVDFITLFRNEPLGQILYSFALSDLSSYNIKEKLKQQSKSNKDKKKELSAEEQQEEEEIKELENEQDDILNQQDLFAIMSQALESCKTSLIAHRIVIGSYIHINNYQPASILCQNAIQLLANLIRTTGAAFQNSKEDILVDYGLALTYFEAPKFFKKALEIFDSVLVESPTNVRARVSKGLILIERGDLAEAKSLLEKVVSEFPNDNQAVSEYSWCCVKVGEYDRGIEGLSKVVQTLQGNTLFILEQKATVYWRLAQSYILKGDHIDQAYQCLVESLRCSKSFAPSYTSLGEIYLNNYKDYKRSTKCFLKAFELDSAEVVSAYYLVKDFSENNQWDQAEAFCLRIVSSESARRHLGNNSWPYRILGCCALEHQDDAKAVEWYQNAIRLDPNDVESWVGLGESYQACGRLEAASKVFKKALELDPNHWIAKYLLGVSQSSIFDFDSSIEIFEELLEIKPDEKCVIAALYEAYLNYSTQSLKGGFFGKAIGLALKAVEYIKKGDRTSLNFWKAVGGVIQNFLIIESKIDQFPHELLDLFKTTIEVDDNLINELKNSEKFIELISLYLIYAHKCALALNKPSRPLNSLCWYNLGIAQLTAYLKVKNTTYRDDSIESFKKSIKLQSNYAPPWIGLGIASSNVNPRIAQHCFIKATALDPKNVQIWSNLALLYLRFNDPSLAIESYRRGQSLAPTEPIAWLGHAFAAEASNDKETASKLFTHAFILSNGKSTSAQLSYAVDVCLRRIGHGDDSTNLEAIQEISSAAFGMVQYLKHFSSDTFGLSIICLLLEKLNDYELGLQLSSQLLGIYEKLYEESEDEQVLLNFAKLKAQTARFELGLEKYDNAIESAEEVLQLTEDSKSVISARVVLGLAHFSLNDFDSALEEFKELLVLTNEAKRIVVLVAQVLYVYDTEETKQAALDQLFLNIENAGSSLLITLVIGAIALIENIEDHLEVIKSELETLPLSELIDDRQKQVPYLLSKINEKLNNNGNQDWQRAAIFFPDNLKIWKNIDKQISLKIASQTKVNCTELSQAYLQNADINSVQRSIFITPWLADGYAALQECLCEQ